MTGTAAMTCDACGRTTTWNPWRACSLPCFDRPRPTAEEQQDMIDAAPEALAYFLAMAPGTHVDDQG
ncbi:hypothetical protein [Kitasatospora sp. NPDC059599]|uniref:hypothetical protein n=1 Tax=Kitasatospora sp. NPDC059599 TaxID=3346880 RepID=UPI0036A1888D